MIDFMRKETQHWSDEQLLQSVYGTGREGAAAETHLVECAECAARWQALLSRRAGVVGHADEAAVNDERLRSQRAAVWARIEGKPRGWLWRWAPAGAAAGMIAAGMLLLQPGFHPRAGQAAEARISDQQLFDDAAALSSPEAPWAAAPIRGLFEERNEPEEEVAF